MEARRILVYGVTGSGKSTLAERLSAATGIPWTSVDDLAWLPGWEAVPPEEQRARVASIVGRDEWLLDTAYGAWLDLPLERAQLVVALDYPRWVSLGRLLRRTARRVLTREPVCNGNVETVRKVVARDSIIVWHFRSFGRKRARIRRWLADPAAPEVVHLRRPRQTEAWLASLCPRTPEREAPWPG